MGDYLMCTFIAALSQKRDTNATDDPILRGDCPRYDGFGGRALSASKVRSAVPDEMQQKTAEAVPQQTTVKPSKLRRLLVYCKCRGFRHGSIPVGAEALRVTVERTGAYEAVVTWEESRLAREKMAEFDAVCLNNTTGRFSDAGMHALAACVAGGKGLVGIHAATDSSLGEVLDGFFSGHRRHQRRIAFSASPNLMGPHHKILKGV